MLNLLNTPHKLFDPKKVEIVASELQLGDPDWTYKVCHDPKGTGYSFIEIYDEENVLIGRV